MYIILDTVPWHLLPLYNSDIKLCFGRARFVHTLIWRVIYYWGDHGIDDSCYRERKEI